MHATMTTKTTKAGLRRAVHEGKNGMGTFTRPQTNETMKAGAAENSENTSHSPNNIIECMLARFSQPEVLAVAHASEADAV